MSTYKLLISTIVTGLSQDTTDDPVLQNITEEEISALLSEILNSSGITGESIPDSKVLWVKMKVMEQIYWKLALASAPLYDVTIDGVSVKRKDRFEHYLKLIEAIRSAIARMEEDDPTLGGATARTYTTYADKVYNHNAYVTAQSTPSILILLDSVEETHSNLSLDLKECKDTFLKYDIYYGDTPIIDAYNSYSISKNATLYRQECNIHNDKLRVPITQGYVACVVTLKTGLKACHELKLGGEENVTV
nr:MAG TPA: hypothetical protein [Caudoviricetes sp.]